MRKWGIYAVLLAGGVGLYLSNPIDGPRSNVRLSTPDVYVWNRAWNGAVIDAVTDKTERVGQLTVLTAEVAWQGEEPKFVRVEVDYSALRVAAEQGKRIGLALRVGPYTGSYKREGEPTKFLANLAESIVVEAVTNGIAPTELQLDFDCAESKLGGYRLWVETIRKKIAPVPLTITALPAWLKRGEFKKLIGATDGFVLQVHSLERPKNVEAEFSLCDPMAARKAVERAGRYKKPFRVALPTYGYLVAFNSKGEFAGLSAEGPSVAARKGVQVREVRADPAAMAELVRVWESDRPAAMTGIAWYRLPVAT